MNLSSIKISHNTFIFGVLVAIAPPTALLADSLPAPQRTTYPVVASNSPFQAPRFVGKRVRVNMLCASKEYYHVKSTNDSYQLDKQNSIPPDFTNDAWIIPPGDGADGPAFISFQSTPTNQIVDSRFQFMVVLGNAPMEGYIDALGHILEPDRSIAYSFIRNDGTGISAIGDFGMMESNHIEVLDLSSFVSPRCVTPIGTDSQARSILDFPFYLKSRVDSKNRPQALEIAKATIAIGKVKLDLQNLLRLFAQPDTTDNNIANQSKVVLNDLSSAPDSDSSRSLIAQVQEVFHLAQKQIDYSRGYAQLTSAETARNGSDEVHAAKIAQNVFASLGDFLNARDLGTRSDHDETVGASRVHEELMAQVREKEEANRARLKALAHQEATDREAQRERRTADQQSSARAQAEQVRLQAGELRQQRDAQQAEMQARAASDAAREKALIAATSRYSAVQRALVLKRFRQLPDHIQSVGVGGVSAERWIFGTRYFDFDSSGNLIGSGSP